MNPNPIKADQRQPRRLKENDYSNRNCDQRPARLVLLRHTASPATITKRQSCYRERRILNTRKRRA